MKIFKKKFKLYTCYIGIIWQKAIFKISIFQLGFLCCFLSNNVSVLKIIFYMAALKLYLLTFTINLNISSLNSCWNTVSLSCILSKIRMAIAAASPGSQKQSCFFSMYVKLDFYLKSVLWNAYSCFWDRV